MCGRYTVTSFDNLALEFGLDDVSGFGDGAPRFNIAPTQDAPIIRDLGDDRGRTLSPARWGLVPLWAKDPRIGSRMINARAETAADKPAFRDALRRRRCIVVADGFYEWKPAEPNQRARRGRAIKTPHYIHRRSGAPFAMAGLWERWRPPQQDSDTGWLESFTILTCDANPLMAPLHHRMPVILDRVDYDRWLFPEPLPAEAVADLLTPPPVGDFEAYPVSTRVNKPSNDDPTCVEPAPAPDPTDALPEPDPQGSLFDLLSPPKP